MAHRPTIELAQFAILTASRDGMLGIGRAYEVRVGTTDKGVSVCVVWKERHDLRERVP
mgnify:CR=1 FL=1